MIINIITIKKQINKQLVIFKFNNKQLNKMMSTTNNKSRQNKDKCKQFVNDIVQKIEQLFEQHNKKIEDMNHDIIKNHKIFKTIPYKPNNENVQTFYKYAQDTVQKLKILNKKLQTFQNIKKKRRDIYQNKISLIIVNMKELLDSKNINIVIEQWLIDFTKEMNKLAEDIHDGLIVSQKQSKGFCFGANKENDIILQKNIIELLGYSQMWHLIQKPNPIIQRQIQNKYVQLQFQESVFYDIDKMIMEMWPEPQIIQIPVQHVVEKVVFKQYKQSNQVQNNFMFKEKNQRQQSQLRQLYEKTQKLSKEINFQRGMRQAHEMLVGLGRSQNILKAIEIYKSIPEISHSQAKDSIKTETQLKINPIICNILGHLYEQGRYINRDLKKAVQYFIKSASAQDSYGLYKIGKFLQKRMVNPSELFEQNYTNRKEQIKDAIEHYQKSAQKGNLDAITDLGYIYENGIRKQQEYNGHSVVSKSDVSESMSDAQYLHLPNLQYAVKYYQLAKKEQFPRALNNLGALYIRMKDSIPETMKGSNLQRGIKYLKKAVDLKYGKAYLNLAKCYQKGLGVKKSIQKAKSLYIEGSQTGDSQCQLQYIKYLVNNEIKDSQPTGLKVFQNIRQILIKEPDNQQALYLMGIFQQKGISTQKNSEAAYYYIHKSAKLGYSESLVKLGDYYYSGYFVSKNVQRSKICYQKAIAKGNSQAYINLGLMYQKGIIDAPNQSESLNIARNYYLQAAKLGNPNAFLFINQENIQKSNKHLMQAAELGSSQAIKLLAKTNTTAQLQIKAFSKDKEEYQFILNKYIKQANKNDFSHKLREPKRQVAVSPKLKQMKIYSPKYQRPQLSSKIFASKQSNPNLLRQGYRSQQFKRS